MAEAEAAGWECAECAQENTADEQTCCACDAPRPVSARFNGIKVALVKAVEAIPKMAKLKAVTVTFGGEDDEVTIVTNARVDEGARVVVATIGAVVHIDGEEVEVKKATVGGRRSDGMLCDSPMLGWKGGAAGAAVVLPDSYALGGPPPEERPRGGAK